MAKDIEDFLIYTERAKLRVIAGNAYTNGKVIRVHKFTRNWIKQVVPKDIKHGNYLIGTLIDGSFNVCYIGRSTDQNLQTRIYQHTYSNDPHYFDDDYYFWFRSADSDEEAIRQECIDYHAFGGQNDYLDNDYHPSLPEGMECPWPGCNHVGE